MLAKIEDSLNTPQTSQNITNFFKKKINLIEIDTTSDQLTFRFSHDTRNKIQIILYYRRILVIEHTNIITNSGRIFTRVL